MESVSQGFSMPASLRTNPSIPSIASIANLPWQDRPADCHDVVWRYQANPIIARNALPESNSIFNSAVVPFGDRFAGVFRVDDRSRAMRLHAGFSDNAIDWQINPTPITFQKTSSALAIFEYGYDPRVCWIEDRYYVTWCNGYVDQPTIGIAWTHDFETFHQMENAFLPHNRNGVLFPRKINGRYVMLSRPSDNGHTAFGQIFLSQSHDLEYWGHHRHVMSPVAGWESLKIGAGPVPIETDQGWLLIYHGVRQSCNGYVYAFGAALLDLEQPWKVIARTRSYLLAPWRDYECVGDVANVVFPCAAMLDGETGRLAIYYGVADTATALAFAQINELLDLMKDNPND